MLTDEIEEKVVERFVRRIEKSNLKIIKTIGETINRLKTLRPTEANQLVNMLRYGGDYNKILNEIQKVTNTNINELDKMFNEVAKANYGFANEFYKYRNIKPLPYDESPLKRQVDAFSKIAQQDYMNLTNSLAFRRTVNGNVIYEDIGRTYHDILDESLINIVQGKSDFESEMTRTLKELVKSGIRTVDYESGKSMRLDSAVRMQLRAGVKNLHNEVQKQIGEEIKTDGVEISVHTMPAPDHARVQGRQFTNEEYEKLQTTGYATDTKGNKHNLHYIKKDGGDSVNFRPISAYNCYHKMFSIILGVEEPNYTDEELEEIIKKNEEGFEYDGKKYTLYEGTQMQRQLETEIRKLKEEQILAKTSGDEKWLDEVQGKINSTTKTYMDFSKAGNLRTKMERMNVEGYRYHKINPVVDSKKPPVVNVNNVTVQQMVEPKMSLEEEFYMLQGDLEDVNIKVDNSIYQIKDEKLRNENMRQLLYLGEKYDVTKGYENGSQKMIDFNAYFESKDKSYAHAIQSSHVIGLNRNWYDDSGSFYRSQKLDIDTGFHYKVPDDKVNIYSLTHEFGHNIEYSYIREIQSNRYMSRQSIDSDLRGLLINNAIRISGEKMTITEFKKRYFSGYAMKKRNFEWFAELFAQYELGESTPFTQALGEWLEGRYQ